MSFKITGTDAEIDRLEDSIWGKRDALFDSAGLRCVSLIIRLCGQILSEGENLYLGLNERQVSRRSPSISDGRFDPEDSEIIGHRAGARNRASRI